MEDRREAGYVIPLELKEKLKAKLKIKLKIKWEMSMDQEL